VLVFYSSWALPTSTAVPLITVQVTNLDTSTVFLTPVDADAATVDNNTANSQTLSTFKKITGLTPGTNYRVKMMYRGNAVGVSVSWQRRKLVMLMSGTSTSTGGGGSSAPGGVIGMEVRYDNRGLTTPWSCGGTKVQADSVGYSAGDTSGWHWDSTNHRFVIDTDGWYTFFADGRCKCNLGSSDTTVATIEVVHGGNGMNGLATAYKNTAYSTSTIFVHSEAASPYYYTANDYIETYLYADGATPLCNSRCCIGITHWSDA
jgi:hypothetical protein